MVKNLKLISFISIFGLTACQGMDPNTMVALGLQSAQVASISDDDVRQLSEKSCAEMDSEAKIANSNSNYTKRLNNISKKLGNQVNGIPVTYKVYMDDSVNAWAMANGCIRVYSGLMDLMTDDEVIGVIGHEMGHVALGHSKKAMRVAYGAQIARGALASVGGTVGALTQSQLGDLAQVFVNSKFSQSQELDADAYSYKFLKSKNLNTNALATSFDKLAKLGGNSAGILSTHPASSERAEKIREMIQKDK